MEMNTSNNCSDELTKMLKEKGMDCVSPTYKMALKWLSHEKDIHIQITPDEPGEICIWTIFKETDNGLEWQCSGYADNFYKGIECALKHSLDML